MKALSEFVVRVANLAEAEGRLLQRKVVAVLIAGLLFLGATLSLVVGLVGFATALFLALRHVMPSSLALALVTVIPVAAGLACIVAGRGILQKGK